MSWRCSALALPLLLTLGFPCGGVEVEVGGSKIQLPAPKGFTEVSTLHPPSRQLAETLTPPSNRLLTIYMEQADIDAVNNGQSASWSRYMMVQTDRQSEGFTISAPDFAQVREVLTSQQGMLLENVKSQVNGYFESIETGGDPKSKIQVGNLLPLGVFTDENRRHASESLAKYSLTDQTRDEGYLVSGATNVLHVGNRIVFAYVYATYESEDDRQWVRQVSGQWSAEILAGNPDSPHLVALAQRIDWGRVGDKALIGAIIGGVIGVIITIRRRRKP